VCGGKARLLRTSPPGTNVSITAPESARHIIVMPTRRSPRLLEFSLASAFLLPPAPVRAAGDCELRLAGGIACTYTLLRCQWPAHRLDIMIRAGTYTLQLGVPARAALGGIAIARAPAVRVDQTQGP